MPSRDNEPEVEDVIEAVEHQAVVDVKQYVTEYPLYNFLRRGV